MGCIEFFQDHVNFYDVEKYAQTRMSLYMLKIYRCMNNYWKNG